MKPDDIPERFLEMAMEALKAARPSYDSEEQYDCHLVSVANTIMAATLAEREACAVEADSFAVTGGKLWERELDRDRATLHLAQSYGAKSVADAIRKRGVT